MKTPHPYQLRAIDALYSYFQQKDGNPVIGLPGGTGKSFVMAYFIWTIFQKWPSQRVAMVTHVHTLIEQNFRELIELWPVAPAGICSAGLNQFNTALPIVYAGVQTVVNRIEQLGHRDLLLIDEAHLLSPRDNTRYQTLIAGLQKINPNLKVIGFSATNWRIGQGFLTDELKVRERGKAIFTDAALDLTTYNEFNKFFDEGYLVPPVPKRTETEFDLSEVHRSYDQFDPVELDAASNTTELNIKVCKEICDRLDDRKSWLVACASIDHANKIGDILTRFGINTATIHSKHNQKHNDECTEAWKQGRIRALVTKDMCLVGVNNRRCDAIAVLRGMVSSNLWVQLLSRSTRTFPEGGKVNSRVLDFAGNAARLGPINDPVIPGRPGRPNTGEVPIKLCDKCGAYNHTSARVCIDCGEAFPIHTKLMATPGEEILVRPTNDAPIIKAFRVHHVVYYPHQAQEGKPWTMRVEYHVGDGRRIFREWVCFEHKGLPLHKAHEWWRARSRTDMPTTTQAALNRAAQDCQVPRKVFVWLKSKGFDEITKVEF